MDDEVILKIYRTYSHDEGIRYLEGTIRALNIEKGMLKSDIAEKNDKIFKLRTENRRLRERYSLSLNTQI